MSKILNTIVNGKSQPIQLKGKGKLTSTVNLIFVGEYTDSNGGWLYINPRTGETFLAPHTVTVHTLSKAQAKSFKVPEGTQLTQTVKAEKLSLDGNFNLVFRRYGVLNGSWGYEREETKSEPADTSETAESF